MRAEPMCLPRYGERRAHSLPRTWLVGESRLARAWRLATIAEVRTLSRTRSRRGHCPCVRQRPR
jgi:hypothetical protein